MSTPRLKTTILATVLFGTALAGAGAYAQRRHVPYPPVLPQAKVETYKKVGDVKLNVWIYCPENHKPSDKRAAIVFFFGGGWRSGNPAQFAPQCRYLASRGMVAMTADYRVATRHGVKAVQCVEDAKSAVRWIRRNAERLGVDPNRIAAGGGSAGGHLAAATGTVPDLNAPGEDTSISSVPNALVLFNPALILAPVEGGPPFSPDKQARMKERAGTDPVKISPYHHVKKGCPPAIIFHGKADTTVSYRTAEAFCRKMKRTGNRCELVGYEGQKHGFFNYGRGGNKAYIDTVRRMDEFLVSLGYLKGPPTISAGGQ